MDFLGYYIWQLAKNGQVYVERVLAPYGIGPGQHRILLALYAADGVGQDELTEALEIDKAAIAKSLQRLESQGYIRRRQDAEDARRKRVFLTDKARAIQADVVAVLSDWERKMAEGFSPAELETQRAMLRRMAANAARTIESMEGK